MAEVYWVSSLLDGDPDHPRDSFEVEQAERLAAEQQQEERNTGATTDTPGDDEAAVAERSLPEPALEQERRAA